MLISLFLDISDEQRTIAQKQCELCEKIMSVYNKQR